MNSLLLLNSILIALQTQTYYHLRPETSLEGERDSCYSCHTSIVLDKKDFLPVILERRSIHYKKDVHCSDCHKTSGRLIRSGNPSQRGRIFSACPLYKRNFQDTNKINETCGACHKREYEDFLSGVHRNKLNCVYCHSNHGIEGATLDIIRPEKCSTCHRYPDVAPVKDEFRKAETILMASESYLSRIHEDMPEIFDKYTKKIASARDSMRTQRHRFSRVDITSNSNYILLLSGHIRKEITAEQERIKVRRIINTGIGIIIMLAITGVLYYIYQYYKWRRTLNRR
jgi:hypothetical protein